MQDKIFINILSLLLIVFSSVMIIFSNEKSDNLTIEPYVFENSKKEKVNAEFGRLKVPENREKKNGKTIELAFVRFKSTSKNPGYPIVYLAGGPGGSGIGSAKFGRFKLFMAMRQFGDVIALDQRGTGQSKPNLRCLGGLNITLDKPLSPELLISDASNKLKSCNESWKKNGVDTTAYNTVESANDLNDLRKALGAKKISLWGISYGTHLAFATIRQHGKYIDKAILAGIEGVDDTLKLPSYTQNLVVELDKRLKADTQLSKKVPDLIGLIKEVHNKLENQPVIVELTDPKTQKKFNITIGKYDVQYLLAAFSGSNEAQGLMPKLYYDMSKGDFKFIAQQMVRFRKGRTFSAMSMAMDCASGISKKRLMRIEKEKQNSLFSNAINDPFPQICSAIDHKKLGKSFRKPVKSNVPTLFISGTLDGRTPVSNAEIAIKGFKNSTHLIIDGAGHSDPLFLSTPKIEDTMKKFMGGVDLPKVIKVEMAKPFRFQPIKEETNAQNTEVKKLDDFIKPFVEAKHFSGVVLASKDGKIIYEKAFGLANVEHDVPNKLDTKFGIASITKGMTGIILLHLIQEGKITTADKLGKYIPDFPNGDKITIGMLAGHRSGIKHRVMPEKEETIRYTTAEFVEKVKKAKLAFEPGTDELYSSAGYATLARVLEIASGKSFDELLEKYVFKPAKLNNTTDYDSLKIIKNEAACYLLERNGYSAAPKKDYSFLVGAGSVFSTARDLYKYANAIIDGTYGKNTQLNFVRDGIVRSNGSTNGFRANLRFDKNKKYGYVLVSNLASGANDLILNNLQNVLEGKETTTPKIPNPKINLNAKNNLADYKGRYRFNGKGGGFEIFSKEGQLFAGPYRLIPMSKDKFYSFWNYAEITFFRDEKGKVKGLEWVGSSGKSNWVKD